MIVCKFGGTSVGDAAAIERLAAIVRSRLPERPLIVVSALSGVTNALLALVEHGQSGDPGALAARAAEVVERHRRVARALGAVEPIGWDLDREAAAICELVDRAPRSELDRIRDTVTSYGELWSSRLVTAALVVRGFPAEWFDVRQVMLTDDRFTRATPDLLALKREAPARLAPLLEHGRIPVTQGFIGATADGQPTTLGRGGSDYTASLLGSALGVRRVEIWTDVDGLMTADPRVVPDARPLVVASHHEAAELATFGAKVLHPSTYAPLVDARIPCVVLNSFAPERPGTVILAGTHPEPVGHSPVRSIAWKKGITVVNVRAPRMLGAVGFLRALFGIFERHQVAVDVVATSEVNVSLTIDDPDRLPALQPELEELGDVTVHAGRAIVAVVGVDLRGTKGLAARIFQAVRSVNVEVISQGASEINVTLVVKEDDGAEAVRLLHQEFFGREAA